MKQNNFKTILVTGATGVAGPAIVNKLLKKGYCVKIFSRHCMDHNGFPNEVKRCPGDILDPRAVSQAMKNVDCVLHLAAKLHDTRGTTLEDAYQNINVNGTRILLNKARSSGVRRFVFFSTINVYGASSSHQPFDESAPVSPIEAYSRSKVAAENIVLEAGKEAPNNFDVVVLRLAAVYGKGMKGNYNILIRYLKKGGFVMLGNGDNRRTLIFDEDLAQACVIALEHPNAGGKIYNVTDGATHTFSEIVFAMCKAMGRKPFFIKIPEPWIRGLIRINHKKNSILPLNIFCQAAEKQMESLEVSGQKIQTELGFLPEYNLKKGWHAVISGSIRNSAALKARPPRP